MYNFTKKNMHIITGVNTKILNNDNYKEVFIKFLGEERANKILFEEGFNVVFDFAKIISVEYAGSGYFNYEGKRFKVKVVYRKNEMSDIDLKQDLIVYF
jgi:hypothetical protein